jgi:hypothetical protein
MTSDLNEKLVAWFALLSGLAISAVAIFYSVSGLISIYPMAVVPIIIMGVVIETGKLSMTLWLKQNWNSPWIYKITMIPAILVLMIITSGGVFGYLSKAHSDQSLITGDAASKVQLIDDRINLVRENINTERQNIDAARSALAQLDSQVNARLDRGVDEFSAERSVQIRRNQRTERASFTREITESQNEIQRLNSELTRLNEEKAPLAGDLRKVEAEVGPVKYIAALIYGDNPDTNLLERAVRWVTLMIVLVMDPVAILLLLASQYSFQKIRTNKLQLAEPLPMEKIETTSTTTAAVLSTSTETVAMPIAPVVPVVEEPSTTREPLRAILTEDPVVLENLIPASIELKEQINEETAIEVVEEKLQLVPDLVEEPIVEEIKEEPEEILPEIIEEPIVEEIKEESVPLTYVQNEEQVESNLWTTASSTYSISQSEYIDKVKKLKGIS